MVDNVQKVEVQAELDASQVKGGANSAAQALRELLTLVNQLETNTRKIFTGQSSNLGRELSALTQHLQEIQRLSALTPNMVGRMNGRIAAGGGSTSANNAALQGVLSNIRTDPALQNLRIEREMNKVISARADIYKRIRDVMPSEASASRINKSYREALGAIGDMPEKGTKAWETWMSRTQKEARQFEQNWTRQAEIEVEKRNKNYLRASKATMAEERRLQTTHQQEMTRLFRRDMAGIMTGSTPEERRRMAGEATQRIQGYAARTGMTGYDEKRLLDMYDDAEAKRTARDISRQPRPARPQMTANDRAGAAYAQRDAFMNYNGGANRLASRFQFVGDFAAVGAVMGTAMYAGRSTVQLQSELKQLQAITDATDLEMKSLQGTIFAVGQTTKYSTQQIAQAATVMGQAGYSAAQIRDALPAIANLATAAGGDLEDTVATVTSILSIYDMSIDRTATISNQLAEALNGSKLSFQQLSLGLQYAGNVAADGGIQFEELTAALGAMANAGIRSGSTLGTGLRALTRELENPNDKFVEWLKSVGLTAEDVDIRTQGLAGALTNLTSKSFDSGTAMNVFEVRAAAAFSALSNNLDVMEDLQEDMLNTEAATKGASTQMESLAAQGQRMANAVTEFTTMAGAPLLAFFTGAIGALADMTSGLAGAGPAVQVLTTALAILISIQVGRWLFTMAAGFIGMTPAAAGASAALMRSALAAGNLNLALGIATGGIRAFTVALLASPLTWAVVGLTALTMAFTAGEAATARSSQRLEEYKTKANEAQAQTQRFADRTEELTTFMEMLIARSGSLSGEANLVGQMAEQAAAKFGDWGLVLEGNITTVNELIQRLSVLRQEQAKQGLEQANVRREELVNQQSEINSRNPWGTARGAANQLVGLMADPRNFNGKTGSPPAEGWTESISLIGSSPQIKALTEKLRAGGSLTTAERTTLSAWLRANEAKFPANYRGQVAALRNAINSSEINELLGLDADISRQDRVIASMTVMASDQSVSVSASTAQAQVTQRREDEAAARLTDPAARVNEAARLRTERQAAKAVRDMELWNRAGELASDPTVARGYQRLADQQGVPVQNIILQQLRRGNPGLSQLDLAGGNSNATDNPAYLRTYKRSLQAQLAEAAKITDPAARDRAQRDLRNQLTQVEQRLYMLQNEDVDPLTQQQALAEIGGAGDARGNTTADTSAERASRIRATTLGRSARGLERQIEIAAGNTRPAAGTVGTASEQRAMKFLMDKGLTANQAAGIVGNLVHESGGMNTSALGDNGSAYGLAQWRGDRRSALDSFAKGRGTGSNDFDTQMEFIWKEMNDRGDLSAIQGQTSVAGAAEQFARKFERPRGAEGSLADMAGWNDRLANAQRLAGTGTTTTDQSQVKALLDQWKTTKIDQIKADGVASQISDEELKQRLADFEVEASDYFNEVLSGNLVKSKELMAAAAERAATQYGVEKTNELAGGAGGLSQSILQVQQGYDIAMQAAIDASDAAFRAKGLDPATAQEAMDKRREIQEKFATQVITTTLEMINAFFQAEQERMDNELQRMQLNIDRKRAEISAMSNTYGSREVGDVQRAQGARRGEQLDIDESRLDVSKARGDLDIATRRRDEIAAQISAGGDPDGTLTKQLNEANTAIREMTANLERAEIAFGAMTAKTPQFQTAAEAASAAWAVFVDQQNMGKGVWEDVADGLLNTFNVAKDGFKTLVVDVMSGTKTMGQAFKDFTMSVLQSILDLVAELIAKEALKWVIQMVASAAGGGGGGGGGGFGSGFTTAWHGGPVRARNMAMGGSITGSNPNRDSVLINAMPGEFIMSKSAVDMIGEDTLRGLNARGNTRMSAMPSLMNMPTGDGGVVNVWVVAPDQKPTSTGPRDIVATIAADITSGGVTKRLIKQVVMGG